jgi:hypothetical protein
LVRSIEAADFFDAIRRPSIAGCRGLRLLPAFSGRWQEIRRLTHVWLHTRTRPKPFQTQSIFRILIAGRVRIEDDRVKAARDSFGNRAIIIVYETFRRRGGRCGHGSMHGAMMDRFLGGEGIGGRSRDPNQRGYS